MSVYQWRRWVVLGVVLIGGCRGCLQLPGDQCPEGSVEVSDRCIVVDAGPRPDPCPPGFIARGGRCDPEPSDAGLDACAAQVLFRDADDDGHGDRDEPTTSCGPRAGFVTTVDDCDDRRAEAHPGASEACDGRDDDCDGAIDEGLEAALWYVDCDRDGWAASVDGAVLGCVVPRHAPDACERGAWTAREPTSDDGGYDCDDTVAGAFPGQLAYFGVPREGAAAAHDYDYDCDGVESPALRAAECAVADDGRCGGGAWDGAAPECGSGGAWIACTPDGLSGCEPAAEPLRLTSTCR